MPGPLALVAVGEFLADLERRRPLGSLEGHAGGYGNSRDVLGADLLEGLSCAQGQARPGGVEEFGEFGDRCLADPGARAFEREAEVLGQGNGLDYGAADAVGEQLVSFSAVGPQFRCLAWLGCADPVVCVVIDISDGDQAVCRGRRRRCAARPRSPG